MLGSTSVAAASIVATNSSTPPSSPTRTGRLRGLSSLLHSPRAPLGRAHTSPASPVPGPSSSSSNAGSERVENVAPSPQRSTTVKGDLSGWVPTVGGQSGISRVAPAPQPTHEPVAGDSSSSRPGLSRVRAETYTVGPSGRTAEDNPRPEAARSMSASAGDMLASGGSDKKQAQPSIRFIPYHEPRSTRPSLTFPIMNRTLPNRDAVIRVGRYSERDNQAANADKSPDAVQPVGFKSKVVSRRHCEFFCKDGQWQIRDVKSSSGTFLNHVRLSAAGTESRPYPINDGDIIQLGIDFKGGTEAIFTCVKMRVECNRSWQKALNQFNTQTHQRLRNLASSSKDSESASVSSSECAICLNPVAPCQALFVAPCSHVWHYKCIQKIISHQWPSFQCPNCRAYADLEADVEPTELDSELELDEAIRASEQEVNGTSRSPRTPQELQHSATRATLINGDDTGSDDDEEELADADEDEDVTDAGLSGTASSSHSTSEPVPVPTSSSSNGGGSGGGSRQKGMAPPPGGHEDDPVGATARSATPTSTAQFALAANVLHNAEAVMTPRNETGPFVLDAAVEGSGGGSRGKGRVL